MNAIILSLALLNLAAPPAETSAVPTTRLYVRTVPPGATVNVDGKPLGKSVGLFLVPPGVRRVEIVMDGRKSEVRQVEVADGKIVRIEIELKAVDAAKPAAKGNIPAPHDEYQVMEPVRGRSNRRPKPAEETPVEKALAQEASLDLKDTSLADALDYLRDHCHISIALDEKSLADAGLDRNTRVTFAASKIPLRSALNLCLRELGLTWTVRDNKLLVTMPDTAETNLSTTTYPISDLTSSGKMLGEAITELLAPASWNAVGGSGSIEFDGAAGQEALIISQSQVVHRQVAGFLASLRATVSQRAAKLPAAISLEGYWRQTPDTEAVREALGKHLSGDFKEVPLHDVLAYVQQQLRVNVVMDRRALADVAVNPDTRVTVTFKNRLARELLASLLDDVKLTYAVTDDVLLVTTPEEVDNHLSTALYPVADLMAPRRNVADLVRIIRTTVAPDSWRPGGGPGAIVGLSGEVEVLAICQTAENHHRVADLLDQLRRNRTPQ